MGARTHSRISRPATSEHGSGISFIEKDDEAKRSVPTSAGRSGGDFCAAGTLILRRQGRREEEVCLLLGRQWILQEKDDEVYSRGEIV